MILGASIFVLTGCLGMEPGMEEADGLESSQEALTAHTYSAPPAPQGNYEPPTTDVVFVAPNGLDTNTGTEAAPFLTLTKALAVVNAKAAGPTWTIVLKAGTYREGHLSVTRDNVTIQRYQTDVVRLWGTRTVSGFTTTAPYKATLADSPQFEQSCADDHLLKGTNRHFGSEYALGVIRHGVPLKRVSAAPASGQYMYDNATNVLTLGDASANVEVTSKLWALKVPAANVKLAGLDIQGYGTCTVDWSKTVGTTTYHKAAVLIYGSSPGEQSGVILENSTVANNSASAVAVAYAYNVKLENNDIVNNGWAGVTANSSNGLKLIGNSLSYNNFRRWSNSVEAGVKLTRTLDGVVFNNLFEHNAANGFWCDQHCGASAPTTNWFIIARNTVRYNDRKGIFYEVSRHGVIASNLIHNNGTAGIASFGSRTMHIWNNTLVNNDESTETYSGSLSVVDEPRCVLNDTLPGGKLCDGTLGTHPVPADDYDRCEPSSRGDMANTCNAERVVIKNNIIAGSGGSRPLLNVEDVTATYYGAARIASANDYQAYWRPSTTAPPNLIEWQTNAGSGAVAYTSLSGYRAAVTTRETNSVERVSSTPAYFQDWAGKNYAQNQANTDVWGRGATLPAEVLKAIYWPSAAPSQPTARIGAIEWNGKPSVQSIMTSAVYHLINPTTGDSLYTTSRSEADNAVVNYGYTDDRGIAFHAATSQLTGLSPIYRLMNPTTRAHLFTADSAEKTSAMTNYGFTADEGIGFYASRSSGASMVPLYRLQHLGYFRLIIDTTEKAQLVAAGWNDEGIKMYVGSTP